MAVLSEGSFSCRNRKEKPAERSKVIFFNADIIPASLIMLHVCVPDEETPGLYGFLHVIVHSAQGLRDSASKFLTTHVHSLAQHPVTHICCLYISVPTTRMIHLMIRLITARLSTEWSDPETN